MPTLLPTLNAAIYKAVATAVREDDAPLSAWPKRYPGRWATASRVADIVGVSLAHVSNHCRDLVATGKLIAAHPWPGGPVGYQPTDRSPETAPLFSLPNPDLDERQWLLDELKRWGETHDGRTPHQPDWTERRDPERQWPRAHRVIRLFEAEAKEKGVRYFVQEPCDCQGACRYCRDLEFCDCAGPCGHGKHGGWAGISGWAYALELAGWFR
jgi:hypothetical protein